MRIFDEHGVFLETGFWWKYDIHLMINRHNSHFMNAVDADKRANSYLDIL